ncbi:50S ribosomal protein L30 [Candidatus Woesearchaeota archaeon]|nr:MAG: 50S ribosomal protein L30 [Candidatus Woesearchaeota archaeon]
MAKKEVAPVVAELQKLLAEGKLVFGAERTLKLLREGKVRKVFLASNCKQSVKEDVERFCEVGSIDCVALEQSGEEVGTLCRKPFSIAVVGVV